MMYQKQIDQNSVIPISHQNIGFCNNQELYKNSYNFCESFGITYQELMQYQKRINQLKSSGKILSHFVFSDFDDTLYSRTPQLESDEFAKARWEEWNCVVDAMGLKKFIAKYYTPEWVVSSIKNRTDMILTAWRTDIQNAKIEAVGLFHKDTIIVPKQSMKPKAILDFFLYKLWQLPMSFEFYDDRIKKLIPQIELLSEFMQTSIVTHNVDLNQDFPNQVEKIESNIFVNGSEIITKH